MSCHLRHSSFSNPSITLPTSQLILQPFHCFTYVTARSPTLLLLLLHHWLFTYVTWQAAHGKNVCQNEKNDLCVFYETMSDKGQITGRLKPSDSWILAVWQVFCFYLSWHWKFWPNRNMGQTGFGSLIAQFFSQIVYTKICGSDSEHENAAVMTNFQNEI